MGDRPASMLHRRPSKPDKWREGQANRLADERSGRDKEHGHTAERTLFQIDMSLSEDLAEMMISADVRKDQVVSSPTTVLKAAEMDPTTPTGTEDEYPLGGFEGGTYPPETSSRAIVEVLNDLKRQVEGSRAISLHALEIARLESMSNDLLAKELRCMLDSIQGQLDAERKLSESSIQLCRRIQRIGWILGGVSLACFAALIFTFGRTRSSRRN